jgi:hypothetical protein
VAHDPRLRFRRERTGVARARRSDPVTAKRSLPKVDPEQTSLGLPTIMDRDLVDSHGVQYVHLAVFAIDIDRVYWLDPESTELPFGWEVFLTERFLLAHAAANELLESICMPLLEETPGEPPLGGQIVFAIYDLSQRGELPESLRKLFFGWKKPPLELLEALAALHRDEAALPALVEHCLEADLTPPLAPPTREALRKLLG